MVDDKKILTKVEKHYGKVTPDTLIKSAKDKKCDFTQGERDYLHKKLKLYLTDKQAAYEYRKQLAREYINSVSWEIIEEKITLTVPMYVHDPEDDGYLSIKKIKDGDTKRAVLLEAYKTAAGHLKRAKVLSVYFGLEDETDYIISYIDELREGIEVS